MTNDLKMILILILMGFALSADSHPFTPCDENGMADHYPCMNVDLLHRVHIDHMGGDDDDIASDIWGWTDPLTGKEYAITGLNFGTTFVDISDPRNPVYLGKLNTNTTESRWRDIKTYNNHAFIVSEANGHGMQIFDLTQLRDVTNPPVNFSATAVYTEFGRAHNIIINEATGFAYAVGSREGIQTCLAGLHMINIQNPTVPLFSGCFDQDGYTHDAQCVVYNGPDSEHTGKEICFNANTDTLTIVDVTTKSAPIQLSRTGYENSQYTHQGWLTEDQRYYLMNDERDEQNNGHNTRTYIWDLLDIDAPQLIGFYSGPEESTDHNLYIKGNYAYLSNYSSGLSILEISDIGNANLNEVANFDSFPANNSSAFDGTWSNYPFFDSGVVIMSDKTGGLFILEPDLCPKIPASSGLSAQPQGDNSINLTWMNDLTPGDSYNVFRSEGGCTVNNFELIAQGIQEPSYIDNNASGQVNIGYQITRSSEIDKQQCESDRSMCIESMTTGLCTAAPIFAGVNAVTSSNTTICGLDIQWDSALSQCGNGISYDIFRSISPAFIPNENNQVASAIKGNQWHDSTVIEDTEYYYIVRATDVENNAIDNNVVKISGRSTGPIKNGTWSAGAEVGDFGFNQENRHVGWETVDVRAHSGDRSYWGQNEANSCNDLTSDSILLTAGENSQLSFWTAYSIEQGWDGGVVEVTNDDKVWNPVSLSPDYPGAFIPSADVCGYASGTPSFTGTDLNWTQHTVDLSQYQGQSIKLRWNYSTDAGTNLEGWYLDDISISNAQITSQCRRQDLIFLSSFE